VHTIEIILTDGRYPVAGMSFLLSVMTEPRYGRQGLSVYWYLEFLRHSCYMNIKYTLNPCLPYRGSVITDNRNDIQEGLRTRLPFSQQAPIQWWS
jgi:hypothetical protein